MVSSPSDRIARALGASPMDVVGPALAGVGNVPVQAALRPIRESATSGRFVFLPTPKSDFCHPSGVGESRSGLRDLRLTTLAVASADAQALAAQSCNGQHRASLDRFGLSPKVGFGSALRRRQPPAHCHPPGPQVPAESSGPWIAWPRLCVSVRRPDPPGFHLEFPQSLKRATGVTSVRYLARHLVSRRVRPRRYESTFDPPPWPGTSPCRPGPGASRSRARAPVSARYRSRRQSVFASPRGRRASRVSR